MVGFCPHSDLDQLDFFDLPVTTDSISLLFVIMQISEKRCDLTTHFCSQCPCLFPHFDFKASHEQTIVRTTTSQHGK